ncbi:amidohydrolase [Microlunatus parietis]|uniref:Amidohydrolase 3 domain-containing protein n=1 Tax=Microlunatus parietis TaxID=682979 RepID=A0A7Y9I494_9ACTN|nr:amidohydrolase family protein [Microlunatus parietis]NYE69993.1 hypothetical protein [Microlunatus parietis]
MSRHPLLLRNVRLVGAATGPIDVVITDGRIGGDPAGAEVVDLDGRFLLRGLWDHHVHFDHWAAARRRLDLTGADSAAAVVSLVAGRATAETTMIIGYGFRDAGWPDRPTLTALDRAAPAESVVVLASNDLHCVWLNTAAFRRYGLEPTLDGVVRETPAFAVLQQVRDGDEERSDDQVAEAALAAAARGVVGIVELEFQDNVRIWSRRVAAGIRSLRVECGIYPPQLADAARLGLRTGQSLPDGDGLLTLGPYKIMSDGSLNTRTAACWDRYPEPADGHDHGILQYDLATLTSMITEARAAGLDSAVHAIGDRANSVALNAFLAAGCPGRIEHAQLILDEDLPRFAELGVIASVQPDHLITDRAVADRHWAGRTGRAFPLASLLAAGATLRLGSDAPVSPLDPWVTIAAAVHRTAGAEPPWHPEQRIGVTEALHASTDGRAFVRPGDPADLVITELDPLTATAEQLRAMPVYGTLLGGAWTYRAT